MDIIRTRPRIYVAGPISSNPPLMAEAGINTGEALLRQGFAPFVPHLSYFWNKEFQHDWQTWLELDLPWVMVSHAVYRMQGESAGADLEVAVAEECGIPVYTDFHALVADRDSLAATETSGEVPEPVQVALDRIRRTFARKNADYAEDGSWRSNFLDVAHQMNWPEDDEACETLIAIKQARLRSLRANGRPPANEGVVDTKLDRAVYSVIALAMLLEDNPDL